MSIKQSDLRPTLSEKRIRISETLRTDLALSVIDRRKHIGVHKRLCHGLQLFALDDG